MNDEASGATPSMTDADLAALETMVAEGLAAQDTSGLNVLGFGEVSVALGWPTVEPRFVCKRTPPFTPAQFQAYEGHVSSYIAQLRSKGLEVVDTAVMAIDRGDEVVGYLVQPLLTASGLGHNVLGAAEPDSEHLFLVAVAEAIDIVEPTLSIDAQVTNFWWDGDRLTLLDVGTPFLWGDDDQLLFDMNPFLSMLPTPTRPLVKREMMKVADRWRDPRRVAVDVVANLYREGLNDWVDPTIVAFNRHMQPASPIVADEAKAFYEEDVKTWPRLKRLAAVERWWQTSIRRRPYDFFIRSTFGS